MKLTTQNIWRSGLFAALFMAALPARSGWINRTTSDTLGNHIVDGITGNAFALTAKAGHISTSEGGSVYTWCLASGTNGFQYPAPTLIVSQGATVTVSLTNTLPFPVSLVFPGQQVTASGGTKGLLTQEVPPGTVAAPSGPVTYTFVAANPGTYIYNSGTRPDLQVEMGMAGALIVRPTGFNPATVTTWKGYATTNSAFDQEFLFLLSDMDPDIHSEVESQMLLHATGAAFNPVIDTTKRNANYWFINGRTGPDDMMNAFSKALPYQPYDGFPQMHPGQRLLMRMVGAGRDPHPFHHHAMHAWNFARNGRLLASPAAVAANPTAPYPDLAYLTFTIGTYPGETTDAIFTFTGSGLGWDMYGHTGSDAMRTYEDPNDHLKPFPVNLAAEQDMEFGQWYGGSPFMGVPAALPPGIGGFDPTGAFIYMWHSHNEREIVNNNVFIGGMFTMLLIEPWAN
ncbi:MAG: multicopper oxidase domain-containing protein [Verrucomicrobia bacterium]|nr:multicopper oxidase domain-containing protein [Verrucomicrobiota bacterium]